MKSSIGQIEIVRSIFHGIPTRTRANGADVAALDAREDVCNMEPEARAEIETRLRKVLRRNGRQIVESSAVESKTPAVIKDLLAVEDADFIGKSKELAQILLEIQTARNSAGMLFVAQCVVSNSPAIMLVKIERESGMLAEESAEQAGAQDVRYLRDLFLTSKSKVYKVALFNSADLDSDTLHGWAADVQMSGNEVAAFFLRKYLGCQLLDDPKQLTKMFHQHAQDWTNKCVHNPDVRARYAMAIASELLSERGTVSPRGFAGSNLQPAHRDEFLDYLSRHGVPTTTFDKELSLIESRLKQFSIAFMSGVVVTAPRAAFDEVVKIERLDGPLSRVVIQDIMGDFKGRGVPGGRSTSADDDGPASGDSGEAE
ncbi:nucleoid-associated protein [Micromonospora sp. 067-2]|uniref:nucleoid-associated protein n=1 Tax=Micromonospora sp. 067-2 TaxID=2789270 RepID=UPI00397D0003